MTTTQIANVTPWLEKLEQAIDLDWERRKIAAWMDVLAREPFPGGFEVYRSEGGTPAGDWPQIRINQAIADPRLMLLSQLADVYQVVCRRTYAVPSIRCNYGTCILPSLFGAETFWMDDELNTLPTNLPIGEEGMDRLLERGVPDLNNGFGRQVWETADYYKETLAPYPKIREVVWLYHPDLQGPIDVVELLWGSSMFYAFYDQPGKIKAVTELVTQTYIAFMDRWMQAMPPRQKDWQVHWGRVWPGQVMLRDDSIVNLSPEMYDEFVKPYDERVLERYGGGAIHMCGHIDHCIDRMTDSRRLGAINISQPHLNDMPRVLAHTAGKGVILDLPKSRHTEGLNVDRGVVFSGIAKE